MARATTVRFADEIYARLDQASARTGMPVNSIVIAACLEWMERHTPEQTVSPQLGFQMAVLPAAPRWATLRRALGQTAGAHTRHAYPFENFTARAQELFRQAQSEAESQARPYIGTEHLLLACFDPEFHSAKVLQTLGVERGAVAMRLDQMLGKDKGSRHLGIVPTSRVKKVVEIAFQLAGHSTDTHVGTQHILLALSKEGNGIAAHVLKELGASPAKIEQEVAGLKDPES
ncbi:MAG TPA: Clp protease N-terminal domain-containing protein [Candidatus Dormibacteraeota bacterium]|nr:Clp protease N-terminal domain-containing protein [Candidatus Dormibacteraeota bacterium]